MEASCIFIGTSRLRTISQDIRGREQHRWQQYRDGILFYLIVFKISIKD